MTNPLVARVKQEVNNAGKEVSKGIDNAKNTIQENKLKLEAHAANLNAKKEEKAIEKEQADKAQELEAQQRQEELKNQKQTAEERFEAAKAAHDQVKEENAEVHENSQISANPTSAEDVTDFIYN